MNEESNLFMHRHMQIQVICIMIGMRDFIYCIYKCFYSLINMIVCLLSNLNLFNYVYSVQLRYMP